MPLLSYAMFDLKLTRKSKISRWLLLVLAGFFSLLLTLTPGWARSPIVGEFDRKAPVVLDGRVLFHVHDLNSLSAEERAEIINQKLEQVLLDYLAQSGQEPAFYGISEKNQETILRINDREDLTVTEKDLREERTTIAQARKWGLKIADALKVAKSERSWSYRRQALLFSMLVLAGTLAVHLILRWFNWLFDRQLKRSLDQNKMFLEDGHKFLQRFVRWGRIGLLFGIWTAVIHYITDIFPVLRRGRYWLFNLLRDSITEPIFTLNQTDYTVLDILVLLTLTIGLWFVVRNLTKLLKSRLLSRTSINRNVQDVVAVLTQYTLSLLGLIIILQIWGLDVSSLTIVASVLGVGIGFGLQNIANNLISGLIITFERHIQEGDFVEVGSLMGVVERIGARSTKIVTLDKVKIIVPNYRFLENEVINWTHDSPICRLHVPVGVSYSSDPNKVRSVLLDVAKSHPDVLVNPVPQVWFKNFGDSSLNFDLLVWTREPTKQFPLKSDLYYRIQQTLRHHQIEIPFPQRDLHLRSTHIDELLKSLKQLGLDPVSDPATTRPPDRLLLKSKEKSEFGQSVNLDDIISQMQGAEGVEIKDRWYRKNLYPACFIGAEAVDWFMRTQNCQKDEAIALGQLLCDRAIVHHVADDLSFMDGYQFYRFSN